MKKKMIFLILTAIFLFPSMIAYAFNAHLVNFPIYVNDIKKEAEYPVYVIDGRTYLSLVDLSKFLGATIKWNDNSKTIEVSLNSSSQNQKINTSKSLNNLIGTWRGSFSDQFGPHGMTIVFKEFMGEIIGECSFWPSHSGDAIGNGSYVYKVKMIDNGTIELIGDAWILKQPIAYPMQAEYSMINWKVKVQDGILDGKSDDNYKITLYKE